MTIAICAVMGGNLFTLTTILQISSQYDLKLRSLRFFEEHQPTTTTTRQLAKLDPRILNTIWAITKLLILGKIIIIKRHTL